MRALGRWLLGLLLLRAWRHRRREARGEPGRIVEDAPRSPGAELVVVGLLFAAALLAIAFVVVYVVDGIAGQVQLMGAALGGAFIALAAALILAGKTLVPDEELEEEYPEPEHPQEQEEIDQIVRESGSRITRKGLLGTAAGAAVTALGAALVAPLASLGPFLKTRELQQAPWRRGRRLVDEDGKPYRESDISLGAFYTAYPEGYERRELIGGPIVLVRLDPRKLELPAGRETWAPGGIVAYSKICTHAGCAVALYRKPTFSPVEPRPALVCPCHYSTFDPARGAKVIFGPAGRPLPQLPVYVDRRGQLRARGNLSGPPGPSWWGVRSGRARSI
ncbi:MAG: ubiquinol-cytochrome c reductase iron-sulfur subunit [Thermoleophilaceae bacterium]